MQVLERLQKLSDVIAVAGGKVEGRKKLHKLVYLSQSAGIELGQDFIFHFYGVFSPSLAADLNRGVEWGMVRETLDGDTYVIAATHGTNAPAEDSSFQIVETLAKETAKVLEVLSTIVYLKNVGYQETEIPGKLQELKGHLQADFPHAKKLAMDMFDVKCA